LTTKWAKYSSRDQLRARKATCTDQFLHFYAVFSGKCPHIFNCEHTANYDSPPKPTRMSGCRENPCLKHRTVGSGQFRSRRGRSACALKQTHPIARFATGQTSALLADRYWSGRRCRVILFILGDDRLQGFLWPKFRSADCLQAGTVPVQSSFRW